MVLLFFSLLPISIGNMINKKIKIKCLIEKIAMISPVLVYDGEFIKKTDF